VEAHEPGDPAPYPPRVRTLRILLLTLSSIALAAVFLAVLGSFAMGAYIGLLRVGLSPLHILLSTLSGGVVAAFLLTRFMRGPRSLRGGTGA